MSENSGVGTHRFHCITINVYQFLAHGWWFSPGISASSTIKTDHHDIAEILLKVALNTNNQIKIITINSILEMPLTLLQLKNIYSYKCSQTCPSGHLY
jgi:hypothetical protein